MADSHASSRPAAEIRCPDCGVTSLAPMPSDACLFFWDCPACDAVVRPKAGDCCVFCSFGTAPCTPRLALERARSADFPPVAQGPQSQ
ncbi:MAG: GDCCVxC domain-containing (seleno)protein [Gemmatimonadaceae bacterium]